MVKKKEVPIYRADKCKKGKNADDMQNTVKQ